MKHIKFLSLFILGGFISSCESDYLEPALTSAINGASYYNSADQVETAVINMYDGLQGVNSTSSNDNHATQVEFYLTEMRSDNTRTKASEGEPAQFENYTVEATNGIVGDYYRSFYNVIFRANTVLANLEDLSSETAAKYEAEAKFVRAYAYFNLVRLYGDIPLVESLIGPLDTEVAYTRVAASQIYTLIVSDLNTAVLGLDNTYRTRASKQVYGGYVGPRVKGKFRKNKGGYFGAWVEYGHKIKHKGSMTKDNPFMEKAFKSKSGTVMSNGFKDAEKIFVSAVKSHEKRLQKYGSFGY